MLLWQISRALGLILYRVMREILRLITEMITRFNFVERNHASRLTIFSWTIIDLFLLHKYKYIIKCNLIIFNNIFIKACKIKLLISL